MAKLHAQVSRRKTMVISLIQQLILVLSKLCERAEARGDPGLVDLKHALKKAQKLLHVVAQGKEKYRWEQAGETVLYLVGLARKIYSLLSNCLKRQNFYYDELWKSYTSA